MQEADPKTASYADDAALLAEAAERAADLALQYFGKNPKVWHKENDAGPVTEADLAVDTMLRETLTEARPDYGWLSEETPDTPDRLDRKSVFIVDPIDGTSEYINVGNRWAHSLAIATEGKLVAAAVMIPVQEDLYTATAGGGAFLNGKPVEPSERDRLDGGKLFGNRHTMKEANWPGGRPEMALHRSLPLAYQLSSLANGQCDAMARFGPIWEWDLAGGGLVVLEAGQTLTDAGGEAPAFNCPHPRVPGVLAGNAVLHAELLNRHRN
ncbi:MAG: 3'(2'),5'-bisphosphate nucleotidase CysQ [Pseudomonadota bacterium]